MPTRLLRLLCAAVAALAAIASRAGDAAAPADPASPQVLAALGRIAFFDPRLSASGQLSCASCHDPAHAFAPPNALAVQLGGKDGRTPGTRAVPSLMYLQGTTPFVERQFLDDDGGSDDDQGGPTGGLTWDGRVDTLHDQARIPLFAAHEMGNESAGALRDRLRDAPYAEQLREAANTPGRDIFDDADATVALLAAALEAFQQGAPEFQPFSSKYDAVLRHQAALTPQEQRGLKVYDDPQQGNCASCHPDSVSARGAFPLFTDYGHVALGVPRNRAIVANRDPAHFDLGLCGPDRTDLQRHDEFCGFFITPTLRNVATRHAFFHNGEMSSLREAVAFYAQRDTNPAHWYPRDADGRVRKYDDLPARFQANVSDEIPFKPGPHGEPRLSERDIDDLVAFLKTLTDGYAAGGSSTTIVRR